MEKPAGLSRRALIGEYPSLQRRVCSQAGSRTIVSTGSPLPSVHGLGSERDHFWGNGHATIDAITAHRQTGEGHHQLGREDHPGGFSLAVSSAAVLG
jgi:hypothetical protein